MQVFAIDDDAVNRGTGRLDPCDPVTGLPGRYLLLSRLEHALEHARRRKQPLGVLFVSLDDLQRVNHSLGYPAGDHLLREASRRLMGRIRKEDSFGRLYGGKFLLILEDMHEAEDAARVARDLLDSLSAPLPAAASHEVFQSASIGISIYPNDGETAAELVRHAEVAMKRAREMRRGKFCFHTPDMDAGILARMEMESALCQALKQQELVLYFQPKVDLHNHQVSDAEALIRWCRGDTMVSPGEFIPLAEKTGLIVPIGAWVIDTACACLRAWSDRGLDASHLAVNVSARQFRTGNLDMIVAESLERHGVNPARLELELTESMLMEDPEATSMLLHRLKAIGVQLSLDDFGTGYSCLAYLARFPIDTLKVDQSFVRDMVTDANTAGIVAAIISLAHKLGLHVVAEGVENEAQLGYLRKLGCDKIQGYLIGRPMPEQAYLAVLGSDATLPGTATPETDEPTLLLVDDEPGILASLRRMLRRDGYRILTAADAAEGLEVLARETVQVVVSDQRMPGMSGTEFLARVKDMHPDCQRIILSGQADMASVLDAINNGAVYKFFTKPWNDDQLRERISEAFRMQAALNSSRQLPSS